MPTPRTDIGLVVRNGYWNEHTILTVAGAVIMTAPVGRRQTC